MNNCGFDIGFDDNIPESIKDELRRFVTWAESNYEMPLTLWVDFEYKHYLVSKKKGRVGFLFYWSEDCVDMPVLRLPVRTERSSIEEILGSFCEGLCCYFALVKGEIKEGYKPDEGQADAILEGYLEYARN